MFAARRGRVYAALALSAITGWASQPVSSKPESLGFSTERLRWLHETIQREVDEQRLAGVTTLLLRHGQVVEQRSYGVKDIASSAPMTNDTIFRIYSMTKPVTGVAMMILYEEGKWRPSDPISKFIPEFADLKVFKDTDPSGTMLTEPPEHAPTMGELMTHTAGFTYGLFGATPVDKQYMKANWQGAASLQDQVHRLAGVPLLYQPGTKWVYSVSMDIQGYIIEKISGKSLPDFMEERIFKPLRMKDTAFFVPKDKRDRFATLYGEDPQGKLVVIGGASGPKADYLSQPGAPSGGGGLVSTANDYARLAQMLLNRGELDGARILSPATVDFMTTNHLASRLLTGEFGLLGIVMQPGHGWAYDMAVFPDPAAAQDIVGKGTYYWAGAADTWFWVDPTNDLIFIGMTQRMVGPHWPNVQGLTRPVVYGALVNPKL
jgi:CubicO group peptidase (beta-lactamase class C family)